MNSVCPRCQRNNPSGAAYCWFDGSSLAAAQDGVQRLANPFIFASGRRCNTLEEFAQACQDEWNSARDLLAKDAFRQFFIQMGRHDLVRLAQEVMQEPNHDVGLSRFVDGLPVVRTNAPKLDLQPRRFTLGRIPGEKREIDLLLVNVGKGTLQGTVTVNEGNNWLSLPDATNGELRVQAAKEQHVRVLIDAAKLKTSQSYVGQLMAVTSGGVAEVPIRFDLVAKPFAKPPFQGVRTPRELAEKMRSNPKQAGPLLEAGDIERWFASNNWDFPVQGEVAKGVAGVQQFFEAMGLSKPPVLQLSQKELRFSTQYPDKVRFQVAMQTSSRKWVYGQVRSTRPWVKVLTPRVIGPQHASILLEADPQMIPSFPPEECRIEVQGNGGQKLEAAVILEVRDPPKPAEPGRWRGVLLFALLFVVARLALFAVVDFGARGAAAGEAARAMELPPTTFDQPAAALQLQWMALINGVAPSWVALSPAQVHDFQYYYVAALVRHVVKLTWWLGPMFGIVLVVLRSESSDRLTFILHNLLPALVAGTVAGVLLSATAACVYVAVETIAHFLWWSAFGVIANPAFVPLWLLFSLAFWVAAGALVGVAVAAIPGLRGAVMPVMQKAIGGALRLCGLGRVERFLIGEAS